MSLNFAQLHIPGRGFRPSAPPRSSGCGGGITEALRGAEVTELVGPGEHNGQGESNGRDKTSRGGAGGTGGAGRVPRDPRGSGFPRSWREYNGQGELNGREG